MGASTTRGRPGNAVASACDAGRARGEMIDVGKTGDVRGRARGASRSRQSRGRSGSRGPRPGSARGWATSRRSRRGGSRGRRRRRAPRAPKRAQAARPGLGRAACLAVAGDTRPVRPGAITKGGGPPPKGRTPSECLSRDGGDPLSHGLLRSTMGARGLSFRVRDGSGRSPPAMAAGPRGAFTPRALSRALGAAQHDSDDSLPHAAGPRPGLPPRGA